MYRYLYTSDIRILLLFLSIYNMYTVNSYMAQRVYCRHLTVCSPMTNSYHRIPTHNISNNTNALHIPNNFIYTYMYNILPIYSL